MSLLEAFMLRINIVCFVVFLLLFFVMTLTILKWLRVVVVGEKDIFIFPVSILRKSISGRHRPVRVADRPMTARCRFT